MYSKILVIFVLFFVLQSCGNNEITSVNEEQKGEITFKIDKKNTPSEISEVLVRLSRVNYETQVKIIPLYDSLNVSSITFENIVIGKWNILVDAVDQNGTILYSGKTDVNVLAGTTVPIYMDLNPTSGNIFLIISWGRQNYLDDYPLNPILTKLDNDFDHKGVSQAMVIKKDNGYKAWFGGLAQLGSYIFYAESQDGYNWQRLTNAPVIFPGDSQKWDSRNVGVGPVLFENGHYKMYYNGRTGLEGDNLPWSIGIATSPDGIHWEKSPDPVLTGSYQSWDLKIGANEVIKIKNKYYLYYTGKNLIYDHKIGLAISEDGSNWEKYSGNPILTADVDWEGTGIYYPSIVEEGGIYVMIYQNTIGGSISGFGLAYSTDGINWIKYKSNPVFTSNESLSDPNNNILYPNLVKENNGVKLYYTSYNVANDNRTICVATKIIE